MPGDGATQAQRKRNREAADWILRNGDPHQRADEKTRFKAWLDADPENCRTYHAAERLLGDARKAIQSDPVLSNIRVARRGTVKPVVASLFLAAIAGGAFFLLDGPMRLQADVIAGTDDMPVVTLKDGSTVQLNASSAIAVEFTDKRRIVRLLRGQAYFEVAHAAERPFSVEAGSTRVTAIGTAFDVRYGETDTEVTVTQNAVMVEKSTDGATPLHIGEGEQAIVNRENGAASVRRIDSLVALSWRRGQIAVDNAPLSYVVEEINRHFSGRIVIAGRALADRRVSGTIAVADTDAALSFIKEALGVKITRIGPLVVIRR